MLRLTSGKPGRIFFQKNAAGEKYGDGLRFAFHDVDGGIVVEERHVSHERMLMHDPDGALLAFGRHGVAAEPAGQDEVKTGNPFLQGKYLRVRIPRHLLSQWKGLFPGRKFRRSDARRKSCKREQPGHELFSIGNKSSFFHVIEYGKTCVCSRRYMKSNDADILGGALAGVQY